MDVSVEEQLAADRAATVAQLAALTRDFEQLVAASESSNADDEHDPEGATIGFERAQLAALIDQAKARLADLDRALEQVQAGGYGVCERCGAPIAPERLEARPSARTCISCAR
jgi:DnaK suppressor protein